MGSCKRCCAAIVVLAAVCIGLFLKFLEIEGIGLVLVGYAVGKFFLRDCNVYYSGLPFESLCLWLHDQLVDAPPDDMVAAPAVLQPSLALLSGGSMPIGGYGLCCRLSSLGQSGTRSVLWYLLMGGRHLDDAADYGNHVAVGEGIRLATQRGVSRSDIFLTTKTHAIGKERVNIWVPEMLKELQVDYVDLVLIHTPIDLLPSDQGKDMGNFTGPRDCGGSWRQCRIETWMALAEFKKRGLIRNIGVSNFGPRQMTEILDLNVAPISVNQLEYHPWVPEIYRQTMRFCHERRIAVTAYCSVGGPEKSETLARKAFLQSIGQKYNKSASQVLLRWAVQQNISVIPGTGKPKHMRENLDIYDFALSSEDMAEFDALKSTFVNRAFATSIPDAAE